MSALDVNKIFGDMVAGAATTAGTQWSAIGAVMTIELKAFAERMNEIANALAAQTISKETAEDLTRMARNHLIATIATLTVLVLAAVERIVDAALKAAAADVNAAIGFTLL